jgi:hypothetical protein
MGPSSRISDTPKMSTMKASAPNCLQLLRHQVRQHHANQKTHQCGNGHGRGRRCDTGGPTHRATAPGGARASRPRLMANWPNRRTKPAWRVGLQRRAPVQATGSPSGSRAFVRQYGPAAPHAGPKRCQRAHRPVHAWPRSPHPQGQIARLSTARASTLARCQWQRVRQYEGVNRSCQTKGAHGTASQPRAQPLLKGGWCTRYRRDSASWTARCINA